MESSFLRHLPDEMSESAASASLITMNAEQGLVRLTVSSCGTKWNYTHWLFSYVKFSIILRQFLHKEYHKIGDVLIP